MIPLVADNQISSSSSSQNNWEKRTSGESESSWFANIQPIKFTKLTRNISTDVMIIGGGIAGMTTAYLLSKAGKKVILVEDGYIGSGETGRTTAHITHALDDRYYNLEKIHEKQGAQKAAESHTAAIDLIESIAKEEKIDCEFERLDGFLFLDPTDKKESLDKELKATHNAGISNTEIIQQSPLPSFDTGPCLRFPNQAQFQPLKYLYGLAGAITNKYKGEIFTETHAQEINFNDTATTIKTLEGYTINATNIVIATNAPIVNETSKIYDKQEPYRTYVIGASLKKYSVPKALYWDTGDQNSKNRVSSYHYIRIQNVENSDSNDLLIVGGEDHKTGETDDGRYEERFGSLEAWTRKRFPIEDIKYKWSGQVMEPMDSLAFIGHNPGHNGKNLYIATGDSGNGITHGTIAGMILSDSILRRHNPWQDVYDPSRHIQPDTTTQGDEASPSFEHEQQQQEQQHGETTAPSPSSDPLVSLSSGQGTVLEDNKIAVSKDKTGNLHTYSAVCTHLGCTVSWNGLEKSFDCPCHGSRFSNRGKVINGPANADLEPKNL
jgi:glycine/D-amino acid oxidase-like deaminating enzyme/nitrite reductase/ring-hydroxylating ferredoxin subunit